jgi:hypothetical protein
VLRGTPRCGADAGCATRPRGTSRNVDLAGGRRRWPATVMVRPGSPDPTPRSLAFILSASTSRCSTRPPRTATRCRSASTSAAAHDLAGGRMVIFRTSVHTTCSRDSCHDHRSSRARSCRMRYRSHRTARRSSGSIRRSSTMFRTPVHNRMIVSPGGRTARPPPPGRGCDTAETLHCAWYCNGHDGGPRTSRNHAR